IRLRTLMGAFAILGLAFTVIVQSVRLHQALIRERQFRAEADFQARGYPHEEAGQRPGGLVEGPVTIASEEPIHNGPTRATLRRVWQYGGGQDNQLDGWLSQRNGGRRPLYLHVGGTRFSLVIVNETVTPMLRLAWLAPGCPEELWRLEGREIEQFF